MSYCECHGHLMMDGKDYAHAKLRHAGAVDQEAVRHGLSALSDAGITYFRDGGDRYGVSAYAAKIAHEYGITYVTPLFAIHKKGRYGQLVGHGYADLEEYRSLVEKVKHDEGDFIKIMVSGIITFREYGELSCPSLSEKEIRELTDIAHSFGFPVMVHVNGDEAARATILAGAESIEHGAFMQKETLEMLAASKTVWVPTAAAIAAFTRREGVRCEIAEKTLEEHLRAVKYAAEKGAYIAAGSDSGASGVPHGQGTKEEYRLLTEAGVGEDILERGNALLSGTFLVVTCPQMLPLKKQTAMAGRQRKAE